jgi:CRP-like cAMP-binding protein
MTINKWLLDKYSLEENKLKDLEFITIKALETIIYEGDLNNYLWLVESGKVKVCSMMENGSNLILSYYVSGGILGDIELLTNDYTATVTVITLSEVTCVKIPIEKNLDYLTQNLAFIRELATGLTIKLQDSSNNYLSTALFSGEERLCSYILDGSYKHHFQDNLRDVSETLGLSYRHVSRLLKKLVDEQIIERQTSGYYITNEEALRKLSMTHKRD